MFVDGWSILWALSFLSPTLKKGRDRNRHTHTCVYTTPTHIHNFHLGVVLGVEEAGQVHHRGLARPVKNVVADAMGCVRFFGGEGIGV